MLPGGYSILIAQRRDEETEAQTKINSLPKITHLGNGRAGTGAQGWAFEGQLQSQGHVKLNVSTPVLFCPIP